MFFVNCSFSFLYKKRGFYKKKKKRETYSILFMQSFDKKKKDNFAFINCVCFSKQEGIY